MFFSYGIKRTSVLDFILTIFKTWVCMYKFGMELGVEVILEKYEIKDMILI